MQSHDRTSSSLASCPVGVDLSVLGKKWTFHILRNIESRGIDRFNQILRSIPGLTPRVLVIRLRELERSGLARPVVIRERPRLVRWELTEKGRDTIPIAEGYENFSRKWYPGASLKNHAKAPKEPRLPFVLGTTLTATARN